MTRLAIIADSPDWGRQLQARFAEHFETECFQVDALPDAAPGEFTFVDINLKNPARAGGLKAWLKRRPADAKVIFGINRDSHLESIQAFAFGATGLLPRPVDGQLLSWMLSGGLSSLGDPGADPALSAHRGIFAGMNALQNLFVAVLSGETPDVEALSEAGAVVVARIEEEGLGRWLELVRNHHSQTYQHCLIVTAVAVSFGQHLGFRKSDNHKLAAAGLLHDIGKARIPLEILEKPAALNDEELAVMRRHPEFGFEALRDAPGLQPDMVDMVVHHHEYLDGSGYPHGLHAREISDLVRTITIADVYGALIERRSYKPPLSGTDAYQILQDMGPKLDKDLVREFRPLAQGVA